MIPILTKEVNANERLEKSDRNNRKTILLMVYSEVEHRGDMAALSRHEGKWEMR